MENIYVVKNEATAARRRVYFHLVDVTDGMTPETGEAAGQPQISVDGAAWTNTGIGTLSAIGNGRYYAELTQAIVNADDAVIHTRYKSANTAECPGSTAIVSARIDAITAILADTGTDGVKLADDAITSGKFDESTAFPLKSADTGSTQVARTGADGDTLETLSDEIALVSGTSGSGAITFTYTAYEDDGTTPLQSCAVWVTTDEAGTTVVAGTLYTDVSGEVTFYLDAGTYYVWRQHPSWNFTNPDTETVA